MIETSSRIIKANQVTSLCRTSFRANLWNMQSIFGSQSSVLKCLMFGSKIPQPTCKMTPVSMIAHSLSLSSLLSQMKMDQHPVLPVCFVRKQQWLNLLCLWGFVLSCSRLRLNPSALSSGEPTPWKPWQVVSIMTLELWLLKQCFSFPFSLTQTAMNHGSPTPYTPCPSGHTEQSQQPEGPEPTAAPVKAWVPGHRTAKHYLSISKGSHDLCVRNQLLLLLATMAGIWKPGAWDTVAMTVFPIQEHHLQFRMMGFPSPC